jgi:hypothetical protein
MVSGKPRKRGKHRGKRRRRRLRKANEDLIPEEPQDDTVALLEEEKALDQKFKEVSSGIALFISNLDYSVTARELREFLHSLAIARFPDKSATILGCQFFPSPKMRGKGQSVGFRPRTCFLSERFVTSIVFLEKKKNQD